MKTYLLILLLLVVTGSSLGVDLYRYDRGQWVKLPEPNEYGSVETIGDATGGYCNKSVWDVGWKIGTNEIIEGSSVSFKDLKLGYIYNKDNTNINLLLTILEKKEGLVQLAHSKSIVLEGESAVVSFEEDLFRIFEGYNISYYSPISSVLSVNVRPIMKDKRIDVEIKINSDYITDASTKRSGVATTNVELTEDKIAVIGGIVEERGSLTREGAFLPVIPTGKESKDSFIILLSAKTIPEYDDASMIVATQLDIYKKDMNTKVVNHPSKELDLSVYPVSIVDFDIRDPLHTTVKSGLELKGTFPIDVSSTLSLSGIYIPDGMKTGKIEIDSSINSLDGYIGLGYRVAILDPTSLNCLYMAIDGKT
ncbi:MAG: hypothetical protein ACP5JL_04360, partial [bacterium]